MHSLLLHNGQIRDTTDVLLRPGQAGLLNGWGVFSTLRVVDGVLFSWERHWARMARDAKLLRVPFPGSATDLEEQLLKLVDANEAWNATLRVAVIRNHGSQFDGPGIQSDFDVVAFTKDLKDWGSSARLEIVPKSRQADHEFAGTKMLSWSFNLILLERAKSRGFDEIVMLNERGEVSECTSANIFAVFGDRVLTPPISSGCLPGITRAILLDAIRVPGLKISERPLAPADLEAADEIFLTSSTRDLLPASHIEGLSLKTPHGDSAHKRLLHAYREYVGSYAAGRRRLAEAV